MEAKPNPLIKTWNLVSIPLSVLGLLSLSDDLIAWQHNIKIVIASYQSIVHPILEFLLGWMPIEIPKFLYDYFFIGFLFRSAAIKTKKDFDAMHSEIGVSEVGGDSATYFVRAIADPIIHVILAISAALIWPFMIFVYVSRSFDKRLKTQVSSVYRLTLQWFLSVLLIFFIVLVFNYTYLLR